MRICRVKAKADTEWRQQQRERELRRAEEERQREREVSRPLLKDILSCFFQNADRQLGAL